MTRDSLELLYICNPALQIYYYHLEPRKLECVLGNATWKLKADIQQLGEGMYFGGAQSTVTGAAGLLW